MKNYLLTKKKILDLEMKAINYDFEVLKTNKPTRFIKIIIHHTKNLKTIQDIIDTHVKKNRFSAIGYHFLIGKNGQIYYARELKFAGAHTFGYNRNSIGIALFGDFDEKEPSEKQINTLKKLVEQIKNKYTISEVLGHNEAIYNLLSHRFYKLHLEKLKIDEIKSEEEFKKKAKDVTTKILVENNDKYTIDLISKLKTCPGFHMYKFLNEMKKIN